MIDRYPNYDMLSLATTHISIFADTENVMATATGFFYEFEGAYYLITNGHNVTGLNAETGEQLNPTSAALPKTFQLTMRQNLEADYYDPVISTLKLYRDKEETQPAWYIHPTHGYKVDVVAISIGTKADIDAGKYIVKPVNTFSLQDEYPLRVADDVYILGHPLGLITAEKMPIWKRGTIATEPKFDYGGLPRFLVDTATRTGMSGAPVIMYRNGVHGLVDGEPTPETKFGRIRRFAGIYSGRIKGKSEFEAQLGIIWKPEVIDEILTAKKLSGPKFS